MESVRPSWGRECWGWHGAAGRQFSSCVQGTCQISTQKNVRYSLRLRRTPPKMIFFTCLDFSDPPKKWNIYCQETKSPSKSSQQIQRSSSHSHEFQVGFVGVAQWHEPSLQNYENPPGFSNMEETWRFIAGKVIHKWGIFHCQVWLPKGSSTIKFTKPSKPDSSKFIAWNPPKRGGSVVRSGTSLVTCHP